MNKIEVVIEGLKELHVKIQEHQKKVTEKQLIALKKGAVLIQNTAVKSLRHIGGGIEYQKYRPHRVHRASAPGEPPAKDTGRLSREIGFEVNHKEKYAEIISRAPYSKVLEEGSSDGKLKPRPFMGPAYLISLPEIKEMFKEAANG